MKAYSFKNYSRQVRIEFFVGHYRCRGCIKAWLGHASMVKGLIPATANLGLIFLSNKVKIASAVMHCVAKIMIRHQELFSSYITAGV